MSSLSATLKNLSFFFLLIFCLAPHSSSGWESSPGELENQGEVLGDPYFYTIKNDKETLIDLARRYDLGYNEISGANPDIDPWYPGKGTRVILPTSWIMPKEGNRDFSHPLLIVNLGELRLYFMERRGDDLFVASFPVGVGRQGFETDPGRYWIIEKKEHPYWNIPASLRDEYPEGLVRVPPGPANPLGDYALRLNRNDYLIHGTNKPLGIGRRISHGCIRMYPGDIERLYGLTQEDCEVVIVYETVKVGVKEGTVYIEVHSDYLNGSDQALIARHLLMQRGLLEKIDPVRLRTAVEEQRGIPVPLS